jgi:hypothetical protein
MILNTLYARVVFPFWVSLCPKSVGNNPYFLAILRHFLASSGEYNPFYAPENERTVSDKKELLITSDSGGSNGARNRLWKKKLQEFANEEQLTIMVAHYPPATSKWNKIEHQLFSFISINWRAISLTSLEVVIRLISSTTNYKGLTVTAVKDSHIYPTGIKVTEKEMKDLNIVHDAFHGDWNYTIKPQLP